MEFQATLQPVLNRGNPPPDFLTELVEWARNAPDEIFAPNPSPDDIYALIWDTLGPFDGASIETRRAAMLEVIRVHAGFESSWNWQEGVDTTNASSMQHITGQETGILQVSFDSTWLNDDAMKPFAIEEGVDSAERFIPAMKADHTLALEYYARLVRVNILWAGPLATRKILPLLSRDAMAEFQALVEEAD